MSAVHTMYRTVLWNVSVAQVSPQQRLKGQTQAVAKVSDSYKSIVKHSFCIRGFLQTNIYKPRIRPSM